MRTLNRLTLGARPHFRHPTELLIDGRPLKEHLERALGETFNLVVPMVATSLEYQRSYLRRLLLQEEAVLPSGRRELLVCPICADLGCGCISAFIEISEGQVRWHDFAWENDYAPDVLVTYPYLSFRFDQGEYEAALRSCP